jgi:hypothetical protein
MFVFASVGDDTGSTEIVGPSNAMYVDIAGDDTTGTRGNAARPFLTVQAALAAQVSDLDEVLIGPGSFASAATLTLNAGVKGIAIRGSGMQSTFLSAGVAVDVIDLSTAGLTSASIFDLALLQTGTGQCLSALGTTTGLLSTGLRCERVSMTAGAAGTLAIDFTFVGVSTFLDCVVPTGSISFVTCSRVTFRNTTVTGITITSTAAAGNTAANVTVTF